MYLGCPVALPPFTLAVSLPVHGPTNTQTHQQLTPSSCLPVISLILLAVGPPSFFWLWAGFMNNDG